MRELDKQHNYYWHHSHWYEPWYSSRPIFPQSIAGSSAGFSANSVMGKSSTDTLLLSCSTDAVGKDDGFTPAPPAFEGSILSAA